MDFERLPDIQKRVKFCMRRKVPVKFGTGTYLCSGMMLRYNDKDGFHYSALLDDINRIDSQINVNIFEVDWPKEGNGYAVAE